MFQTTWSPKTVVMRRHINKGVGIMTTIKKRANQLTGLNCWRLFSLGGFSS
jgi:hypothetical protein